MFKVVVLTCVLIGIVKASKQGCFSSITTFGGEAALLAQEDVCAGDLIFDEEFNELNTNVWSHDTWSGDANGEFQTYVDDNSVSWTADGQLFIKPKCLPTLYKEENVTVAKKLQHIHSARLFSSGFHFVYGHVEIIAKMPAGDWLWPAMWLMPFNSAYGDWPRSGEIDMVESLGNVDMENSAGENIGPFRMFSTLHWGPDSAHNQFQRTGGEHRNLSHGYYLEFHKYFMDWDQNGLTLGVDGIAVERVNPPAGGFWELGQLAGSGQSNPWSGASKMAPFDKMFYFILNVAVGGTNGLFPDGLGNKPWKNSDGDNAASEFIKAKNQWLPTWHSDEDDRSALQIKSIKVWAN